MKGRILVLAITALVLGSAACSQPEAGMWLTSPAFDEGASIPVEYTCDGQDISPRLDWSGQPEGTVSYVILMQDPDAPGSIFTHWVIFDIRPDVLDGDWIPAALPQEPGFESGITQGRNSFGEIGYNGPCPPPRSSHRYKFTIYALDKTLDLPGGASKLDVLEKMAGSVLAQGRLTGTFRRSP